MKSLQALALVLVTTVTFAEKFTSDVHVFNRGKYMVQSNDFVVTYQGFPHHQVFEISGFDL